MSKRYLPKGNSASAVTLEPDVAIAIIGLFSAYADHEGISIGEEYALSEILGSVSYFEDYSESDFQKLAEGAIAIIEEEGSETAMEQAIASLLDQEEREAAYLTALSMVGIDGEVPETENDYLEELQQALDISYKRAQELIDEIFGQMYDEDFYE